MGDEKRAQYVTNLRILNYQEVLFPYITTEQSIIEIREIPNSPYNEKFSWQRKLLLLLLL